MPPAWWASFLIENIARISCEVDLASGVSLPGAGDWVEGIWLVGISRAARTADTLAAMKEARARGARTFAICNVVDSRSRAPRTWCCTPTPARFGVAPPSASLPSSRRWPCWRFT